MTDDRVTLESIGPGEQVYDDDGRLLGRVVSLSEEGFEVEATDPAADTDGESIPDGDFGEAYLMWRCSECGTMGELEDGFPESCPDCGAPREALAEVQED
ncbi:DUF7130 family rubredoxin-like protein [Halobellus captivus]|uniref:DUF7130 family rubredoxin-like protein n=1 Tax=Halobellus captivus TaxID=2592614 RepID=UPI00119E5AF7|nr:hypothetical protein [Halobellus captivus]